MSNGEVGRNREARRTKFWGFGLSHAGASHAPEKEAARVPGAFPEGLDTLGSGLVWTERLEKRDCSFPAGGDPYAASLSLCVRVCPRQPLKGERSLRAFLLVRAPGPLVFSQLPPPPTPTLK